MMLIYLIELNMVERLNRVSLAHPKFIYLKVLGGLLYKKGKYYK